MTRYCASWATIAAPVLADPIAEAIIDSRMLPANSATSVPKTGQPLPLTSSRLRLNACNADLRSITTTGAATAQIVIRIRPGMISAIRPIAIPSAPRKPTTKSDPTDGPAERRSSPTLPSTFPSCTSRTVSTTMP